MDNKHWHDKAKDLLGHHWKASLAHMVGVNKRQVSYWASGRDQIPAIIIAMIDETYKIWVK